jgi:phenylacetate-CoA ligase
VEVLQCYAVAEVGVIAYETAARDGMVVNEHVIVEIVRPGTGDPVADGEVGEVVVTSFNPDYPMIRLATGDLSAVLAGPSPCAPINPPRSRACSSIPSRWPKLAARTPNSAGCAWS